MFDTVSKRSRLYVICACILVPAAAFGHVGLDAPNGGEILTAGSTFSVDWHVQIQHNTQDWDLWYSTTGSGGPWLEITMDLPPGDVTPGSAHSYDWLVPDVFTTEARVRVRMDNTGTDYFDISNGNFTIVPEPAALSLFIVGLMGARRRLSR